MVGSHKKERRDLELFGRDIGDVAKDLHLEIKESPKEPCSFCGKENLKRGLYDSKLKALYCGDSCYYNSLCE